MFLEFPFLFLIALANLFYRSFLFFLESFFFAGNLKLWKVRWLLYSHYLFQEFWIARQRKKMMIKIPEGDLTYGETPFWTARRLILWSGIEKGSVVWDLGCGRGLFVLFAGIYFNMTAVGIDFFPFFTHTGEKVSRKLGLNQVQWIQADFLTLNFSSLPEPNLIYLASTTFSWGTICKLAEKLENLKSGVKVITLSAALPSKSFKQTKKGEFWFSWGKATAYLQEKI
jgi:hypothetical protein